MTTLSELHADAIRLDKEFMLVLIGKYPRADRWTYFRAWDRVTANCADKHDMAMTQDEEIEAAYQAQLAAVHAYYLARDGAAGVLGARGL